MGEPNELPEGGEGGGGIFGGGIRGEWPQEMPVGPDYGVWREILSEVSRLQLRIQVLEGAQLQQRVLGAAGAQTRAMSFIGGPNELPEGGEGGGGGGFGIGGIRGEWPQEMPVYDIFAQLDGAAGERRAPPHRAAQRDRGEARQHRRARLTIPVRNEHALEGLRALLARDGVLWSTPEHPIRHRDGSTAPWMFYSWNVTMTGEGLRLAARALLDRLAGFESTQLAAHGMTGLPLMSACVAAGAGHYTGLAIRKERKNYLSGRRIEGPGDPSRPVVVIDDSLSSGTALADAIRALEADRYTVEGAIAVVGFPGRGGLEWASTAGYRVEVLLDVETDLGMELHRHPPKLSPAPSDLRCRLPERTAPDRARPPCRRALAHARQATRAACHVGRRVRRSGRGIRQLPAHRRRRPVGP